MTQKSFCIPKHIVIVLGLSVSSATQAKADPDIAINSCMQYHSVDYNAATSMHPAVGKTGKATAKYVVKAVKKGAKKARGGAIGIFFAAMTPTPAY